MNYQYQSKQMVADALVKVANSAPGSPMQVGYLPYNNRNSISAQEFSNWVNYVNSTLDISYNHTRLNIILQAKITVSQISSQRGLPYMQLIDQINSVILNLAYSILQYL